MSRSNTAGSLTLLVNPHDVKYLPDSSVGVVFQNVLFPELLTAAAVAAPAVLPPAPPAAPPPVRTHPDAVARDLWEYGRHPRERGVPHGPHRTTSTAASAGGERRGRRRRGRPLLPAGRLHGQHASRGRGARPRCPRCMSALSACARLPQRPVARRSAFLLCLFVCLPRDFFSVPISAAVPPTACPSTRRSVPVPVSAGRVRNPSLQKCIRPPPLTAQELACYLHCQRPSGLAGVRMVICASVSTLLVIEHLKPLAVILAHDEATVGQGS
jgi:hypothetical protein